MASKTRVIISVLETGLYAYYGKEYDDDGRKRTDNIDELLNGIRHYLEERTAGTVGGKPGTGLGDWLEDISLLGAADRDDGGDRAALMTSHCSKGLEFPTVFICGVEDGLYPSLRDGAGASRLEEERRLFYVSVTRARDELVLTSCEQRWQYGKSIRCTESRFINEMLPLEDEEDKHG